MKYRCIIFLSMIYVLFNISYSLIGQKLINVPNPVGPVQAGFLVGVLWLSLCDIIAEVYGMKISITLFWSSSIACTLLAFYFHFILNLPSPSSWHYQASYDLIFGDLPFDICAGALFTVIAWYINIYFLTKWKILVRGRYYWLRSVTSSAIGIAIYTFMKCTASYFLGLSTYAYQLSGLVDICVKFFLIRLALVTLLAFPSVFIVKLLKIIENTNDDDVPHFNPFKMSENDKSSKNPQTLI